ncbi:MAG: hypothetical protein ACNA8W_03320 [Bradymonadaceae bacterium]
MSDPIEILERRLKLVRDQEQDTQGLHFFCQIGGSNDELGIITLQISGKGRLLLSWRQDDGESDLWSVQLQSADRSKLAALLLEHPFWSASPARRSRRGRETNIHLRVCDQEAGNYNGLQFWTGDMDEYPVLRDLMRRLGRLIRNVSNDEITWNELEKLSA